jgi:signal transduction histidine kinase
MPDNMFKKLRNQFLILNMAMNSLAIIAALATVYVTTYSKMQAENERKLDNVTNSFVVVENGAASGPEPQQGGLTMVTTDYFPSFILTVDNDGNMVARETFIDLPDELYGKAAEMAWKKGGRSTITLSGRVWMYKISPASFQMHSKEGRQSLVASFDNRYQIAFLDITDTRKTLQQLCLTLFAVGIGMLAVVFLISLFFANRAIRPISESWEKQKQFVADASHELKTPLATLMANYDALLANEEQTIQSQKEWLDYMKIGMDRMSKLIHHLLTLARTESLNKKADKQPFDISRLFLEIMHTMEAAARRKNLHIRHAMESVGTVCGHEEMVGQVFAILYDNAVKYAEEGGSIVVSVSRTKKQVICSVKNTGRGISPKDLPHIFDRFYRADPSRTGEDSGYGLGLPIARNLVHHMGGTITAKSVENEWTEFIFAFDI